MIKGIDVSEHNGDINWNDVFSNDYDFAIVRLGYGRSHRDSCFYDNICGALEYGLKIGIYYYSYALNVEEAYDEAQYTLQVLKDYGLTPDRLAMGCWFDMEDADEYKLRHGMPSNQELTDICSKYICTLNEAGYGCGIYASLDWLENKIDTEQLADYVPYWPAQWGSSCDWTKNCRIWQHTSEEYIEGRRFDGNYAFDYEV